MSAEHQTHWANIGEAGATTGMRFLLGCYKLGGAPLFKLFLFPVMVYFFVFRSQARQHSQAYLQRAIPGFTPQAGGAYRLGFAHFWSFALALIDKLAVWMGRIKLADVAIHNDELIEDLLARKQGALFLISHLGNFEICRCLSARHTNLRLTVLMHTKHAQKFNRLLEEQVGESNIDIIQVTEITPATAMMLSERAERGEFIAIAGDRVAVTHPENCLLVNFLGDQAPLPVGPFMLASILRTPLIALFCLREQGRYQIYFEQLSASVQVSRMHRREQLTQLAQAYAERLEYFCRREPLQWFNFFDFWHLPSSTPSVSQPTDPALKKVSVSNKGST